MKQQQKKQKSKQQPLPAQTAPSSLNQDIATNLRGEDTESVISKLEAYPQQPLDVKNLDYILDYQEREKFRIQETEYHVKEIYEKYDQQLKMGMFKPNQQMVAGWTGERNGLGPEQDQLVTFNRNNAQFYSNANQSIKGGVDLDPAKTKSKDSRRDRMSDDQKEAFTQQLFSRIPLSSMVEGESPDKDKEKTPNDGSFAENAAEEIKRTQKLQQLTQQEQVIMIKVMQERMIRKINEFAKINEEGEPDLSDEDFFDMGQYALDKEQLLNPNAKLHNLFGGLKQLENASQNDQMKESDEKLIHFDKDYDFSDSDHEDPNLFPKDDRPFANMYSMNTNVEYAVNILQRNSPNKQQQQSPKKTPKKEINQQKTLSPKNAAPQLPPQNFNAAEQKIYTRLQSVSQTVEGEMDDTNKLTDDKVATLRAMKQTPLQKAMQSNEGNAASFSKIPVSPEIVEFDKKFFHRQLDRITKSYQQEMRTMKARARERAIEFVERNMYTAKEAITKEINHVTRQFEKQIQENDILKKHAQSFEHIILDQETQINNLKTFLIYYLQKNPPTYTDDDDDKFTTKQGIGIQARILSLRGLENVSQDKLLAQPFSLYGTTIKLNIDHRIDMCERLIVAELKQENKEVKLESAVLRNDIRMLEELVETTGVRERELAKEIGVLHEEIQLLQANSRKREVFYVTDRAELVRKYENEIFELQEQRRQMHDLTDIEIRVKDSIITSIMTENKKLNKLIGTLETKLKIPRHHFKFLEQHGTLEEFVSAKLEDNPAAARQALDKTLTIEVQKRKGNNKLMSVDQVDSKSALSSNNLKFQPFSQQSPRVKQQRRDIKVKSELGGPNSLIQRNNLQSQASTDMPYSTDIMMLGTAPINSKRRESTQFRPPSIFSNQKSSQPIQSKMMTGPNFYSQKNSPKRGTFNIRISQDSTVMENNMEYPSEYQYQTLNVTNVAPTFHSTARNQYKKAFLRSSLGVMNNTNQDKFMLKENHNSGSGTQIMPLRMGVGYDAWNIKNNNSNISTIIDYQD